MKTPSNWEQEAQFPLLVSCKQAAQLVSLSFERRLTIREFFTMRLHLFLCKTCTFYRRQIAALRRIFVRHDEFFQNIPPLNDHSLTPMEKSRMEAVLNARTRDLR